MKEDLKNKIDHLVQNISRLGTEEGREESDRLMKEAMALAVTPEEKKEAGAYLRQELIMRRKRPDVDVSSILGDTRDILSLSCFSQKYFGKDRSWSVSYTHLDVYKRQEFRLFVGEGEAVQVAPVGHGQGAVPFSGIGKCERRFGLGCREFGPCGHFVSISKKDFTHHAGPVVEVDAVHSRHKVGQLYTWLCGFCCHNLLLLRFLIFNGRCQRLVVDAELGLVEGHELRAEHIFAGGREMIGAVSYTHLAFAFY